MTKFPLILLTALLTPGLPPIAQAHATPEPVMELEQESYSDAELDSILAPVALYPDSVLTHILIAATYPLEVIAANRWRETNAHLSAQEVEIVVEDFEWDPSVKALAPFAQVLATMSEDLDWLQALGENVLISQARVLERVQVLRQHALDSGSLKNSDYLSYDRDEDVIVIEPTRREIVYIPYYDTRVVYGNWWHPVAPVYWHRPSHYVHHADFYWGPSVQLSSFFYFGGIHWHNRYVVVSQTPVRKYYRGPITKRVHTREYQRWQHNWHNRHSRYSKRVLRHMPEQRNAAVQARRQLEYRDTMKRKVQHLEQRRHEPVRAKVRVDERGHDIRSIKSHQQTPVAVRQRDVSRPHVVTKPKLHSSAEVSRPVPQKAAAKPPAQRTVVKPQVNRTPQRVINRSSQRQSVSRSQVRTKER